jgi:DNA-binding response OmpR family regulator
VAASNIILIADRNSHVRMFLMREMMASGYRVKLAANGDHVLKMASSVGNIDLLILDPNLPGLEGVPLLMALRKNNGRLPIILHTHSRYDEDVIGAIDSDWVTVVEKAGDSIERIRETVGKLLSSSVQDFTEAGGPYYREGELS